MWSNYYMVCRDIAIASNQCVTKCLCMPVLMNIKCLTFSFITYLLANCCFLISFTELWKFISITQRVVLNMNIWIWIYECEFQFDFNFLFLYDALEPVEISLDSRWNPCLHDKIELKKKKLFRQKYIFPGKTVFSLAALHHRSQRCQYKMPVKRCVFLESKPMLHQQTRSNTCVWKFWIPACGSCCFSCVYFFQCIF